MLRLFMWRSTLYCLSLACLAVMMSTPPSAASQPYANFLQYKTVGKDTLRVALFRIYNAELSSPSGQYRPAVEPLLLKLRYLRNINSEQLLSKTQQQLSHRLAPNLLQEVSSTLKNLWPDVSAGDELSFLLSPNGVGTFYFNGKHLGSLPHSQFNRAFLDIWLGEDSSYPKMASRLRGER